MVNIAATDPDADTRSLAATELQQVPGGTERLFAPAWDAVEAGRYEDALQLVDIDPLLHELPDLAAALDLRAKVLFALDRADEGLMAIQQAVARRPDDADLQASLGWWSYVSGRLEESIHASQRAVELRPDDIPARFNLGLALVANRDDALAEQTYRQAVEQASLGDRSEAVTYVATAIEELGELERQTGEEKPIITVVRSLLQAAVDNLNADKQASTAEDVAER